MLKTKIYFLRSLPRTHEYYIAFSGGVDSFCLLHYLIHKKYKVILLNIDHLNEWSKVEKEFTKSIAKHYNIPYRIEKISRLPEKGESKESVWSEERNRIYKSMDRIVLTGHHLDDAVGWYIMTTLGQGKMCLMNYSNDNIIRPLIVTKKETIYKYAEEHNIQYLVDPTNSDNSFNLRNKVNNKLLGSILEVFPGIYKTVKKLIIKKEIFNYT